MITLPASGQGMIWLSNQSPKTRPKPSRRCKPRAFALELKASLTSKLANMPAGIHRLWIGMARCGDFVSVLCWDGRNWKKKGGGGEGGESPSDTDRNSNKKEVNRLACETPPKLQNYISAALRRGNQTPAGIPGAPPHTHTRTHAHTHTQP